MGNDNVRSVSMERVGSVEGSPGRLGLGWYPAGKTGMEGAVWLADIDGEEDEEEEGGWREERSRWF
jgi:hypothetical protein